MQYFGGEGGPTKQQPAKGASPVGTGLKGASELVSMQIITSGPDTREPHIRNNYLELFHKAKHNIYIQTP